MRRSGMSWVTLALGLAACAGGDTTKTVQLGEDYNDTGDPDETGPTIEHVPIDGAQTYQQDVVVSATVTDDQSGVERAIVRYKRADQTEWTNERMEPQGDVYQAVIPGADVSGSGMNYYITSIDFAGNVGDYPIAGQNDPLYFRVSAD
jgi:hypothetical protein